MNTPVTSGKPTDQCFQLTLVGYYLPKEELAEASNPDNNVGCCLMPLVYTTNNSLQLLHLIPKVSVGYACHILTLSLVSTTLTVLSYGVSVHRE
jgi:hypothetical protein